jgi:tetratricopeptide (TPR) repeat protein
MFTQSFFCASMMHLQAARVRTALVSGVFAAGFVASAHAADPDAADHYRVARAHLQEARHSTNAVRLFYLGWVIGDELEEVIRLDPSRTDARLDLVRFYVIAPRLVGGGVGKAREQARQIARRDAALGAFAEGYIGYRQRAYGPARKKLHEAARTATDRGTRILALTWLGYLSQETQQYGDAFAAFRSIRAIDASHREALYEIGRTSGFSGLELAAGEEALREYLREKPEGEMPSLAAAHLQLGRLLERRGDTAGSKREIEEARRLDPDVR